MSLSLAPPVAGQAPRQLRLEFAPQTPDAASIPVELELSSKDPDGRTRRLTWAPPPGQAAALLLSPGRWTLRCSGKLFCLEAEIDLTMADAALTVPVFRAAVVRGMLDAGGRELPNEIAIQGRFVEDRFRQLKFLQRARVLKGHFGTRLPTRTLDLRIAAEPYAPIYLWSVSPKVPVTQLVRIDLTTGASVSGCMIDEAGSGMPGLELRARPVSSERYSETAMRLEEQSATASTDRHGFFQFKRLEAGRYEIEGLSSRYQRPLRVAEAVDVERDLETQLGDITLRAPARLEVRVTVETAADLELGRAGWKAELRSSEGAAGRGWRTTAGLDKDGRAVFERLYPGSYVVSIEDRDWGGSEFASRDIEVGRDESVELTLDFVDVRGVVTLGDLPLQAELVLYGAGRSRHPFRTDAAGRFAGRMRRPDAKFLLAQVEASNPVVNTLKTVPLDTSDADPIDLRIRLENYRVVGSVVDESGTPLRDASVRSDMVEAVTDAKGRFELSGLSEGSHHVQAEMRGFADGRAQEVTLNPDQATASLAFVLTHGRRTVVRLTDETGRGLPGVRFFLQWLGFAGHRDYQTDPEGRALVIVPKDAQRGHLRVLSAGYAPWATCVSPPAVGEAITVPVPRASSARIEGLNTRSTDKPPPGMRLWLLFRSGGLLSFGDLLVFGRLQTTVTEERRAYSYVLSSVAPGSYAVVDTPIKRSELVASACSGEGWPAMTWTDVHPGESVRIEPQRMDTLPR